MLSLRHIHLPASPSEGLYPSYKAAAALQELLRRRLLGGKDAEAKIRIPGLDLDTDRTRPLDMSAVVMSFTPAPTYTLGRRQLSAPSLSPAEIARLKAPLRIGRRRRDENEHVFHPAVVNSPRGGLATYHGPGQVVLWPVMMIRGPSWQVPKQFSVRCYSRLLEDTTIAVLQRLFGLQAFTTDDPGVWVRSGVNTPQQRMLLDQLQKLDCRYQREQRAQLQQKLEQLQLQNQLRKISAMGIHLRRHISSLGVAINLDMPTTATTATAGEGGTGDRSKEEEDNPWARFVACGLEGKGVTCVQEELRAAGGPGIHGLDAEVVASAWAEELAGRMGLCPAAGAVRTVPRDEVDELLATAEREGLVDAVAKDEI